MNILFINDWDKPNLCIYNKYEQKNLSVTMSTKIVIQYILLDIPRGSPKTIRFF